MVIVSKKFSVISPSDYPSVFTANIRMCEAKSQEKCFFKTTSRLIFYYYKTTSNRG